MTKTTADTLRKAKALIDKKGKWLKHSYWERDCDQESGYDFSKCCSLGAVRKAINPTDPTIIVDSNDATQVLYKVLPKGFDTLHKYNDHPDTTHADIMALFDRAIELAEKETNQ